MYRFDSLACDKCRFRSSSVFSNLNDEELMDLSVQKYCNYYKEHEIIFLEGSLPNNLYCIHSGKAKIYKSGNEGKEQIVRLAKEGDILGYRALVSRECYSASAAAIEDSKVCVIPDEVFYGMLRRNTGLLYKIMRILAVDLRNAQHKLTDISQKPVIERLAEALLVLVEFYKDKSHHDFGMTISREELASLVGAAPETVVRILSELRKDGIISLDGKAISITNANALSRLAKIYD